MGRSDVSSWLAATPPERPSTSWRAIGRAPRWWRTATERSSSGRPPDSAGALPPTPSCCSAAPGWVRGEPPHSGNAQFYINLVDNPDLDPLPTRWGYAVFGKIVEGMDVVDRIGVTPTGAMGPFKSDAPLKPVIIEKAALLDSGVPTPPSIAPRPVNTPPA